MAHAAKRRKLSNGDAPLSEPGESQMEQTVEESQNSKDVKDQRRSLFVRSLSKNVTTEQLAEHFSQSYPLKHATVVLDKTTGHSRGFGFVTFTDADDAQNAVNEFNDSVMDGRKIKVEIAEARNREVDENLAAVGRTTTRNAINVTGQKLRAKRQEQQQQQRDSGQPPKLIVRNLPWSVKTSDDLAKLFLSYGKVKHAVVPKLAQKGKGDAQGSQQQAGFGIVILRGKRNAEKALGGLNGKEVDGRVLAVDWAVDKETWEKVKDGEDVKQAHDEEAMKVATEDEHGEAEGESMGSDTSSEGSAFGDEAVDDMEVEEQERDEGIDDDDDNGVDLDHSDSPAASDISDDPDVNTSDDNNNTIFIRNLPFTADDDSVYSHFKKAFGPVRYARVVYDHETERSRGTAFVCFYTEDIARDCVMNAPKHEPLSSANKNQDDKKRKGESLTHSLLQNEMSDPSGRYTLEGRVLQIARALPKPEADRRAKESSQRRSDDKRRLFLLSEGTIPRGSPLYNVLSKTELAIRESSAKQRQKLVKDNANLGLSLTRLSVRNIPRNIDSKELKALAREAVVGFARDVKAGKRQPLSREEVARGGIEDREAERIRKEKGRGLVKQVKIVYESEKTGGKVGEGKGGRSRGYGFIEYYGHRNALMGLRWLNGHLIKANQPQQQQSGKTNATTKDVGESAGETRNKRLIVEFAIENAQVVMRRTEREKRARGSGGGHNKTENSTDTAGNDKTLGKKKENIDSRAGGGSGNGDGAGRKRKRNEKNDKDTISVNNNGDGDPERDAKNKVAARNRIIAAKRMKRKMRRG